MVIDHARPVDERIIDKPLKEIGKVSPEKLASGLVEDRPRRVHHNQQVVRTGCNLAVGRLKLGIVETGK